MSDSSGNLWSKTTKFLGTCVVVAAVGLFAIKALMPEMWDVMWQGAPWNNPAVRTAQAPAANPARQAALQQLPATPPETTTPLAAALPPGGAPIGRQALNDRYNQGRAERLQRESVTLDPYEGQPGDTGRTVLQDGCNPEDQMCFAFLPIDRRYPRDKAQAVVRFLLREIAHPGVFTPPLELTNWRTLYSADVPPPTQGTAPLLAERGINRSVVWRPNPHYRAPAN